MAAIQTKPTRRGSHSYTEMDFWRHVDMSGHPSACWPWLGNRGRHGYGRIRISDNLIFAHRFALLGALERDEPLNVLHRCDHPWCVKPSHLYVGTQADNMADMVARNRQAREGKPRRAKLTAEAISEIRKLRQAGVFQRVIAERFGVTRTAISAIDLGRNWKHVEGSS